MICIIQGKAEFDNIPERVRNETLSTVSSMYPLETYFKCHSKKWFEIIISLANVQIRLISIVTLWHAIFWLIPIFDFGSYASLMRVHYPK